MRFITAAFIAFALAAGISSPSRAADVELVPHRAVYDLKLLRAKGTRAIEGVRGRILYDFSGSSCEGYALTVRQVSELDGGEGKSAVTDLRATTWEDGAAKNFRFTSENRMDQKAVENVDGLAERKSEAVSVSLKKPMSKTFNLDDKTVFPTEHMRRVIEAAREGKTILELPVFDGSETGEKIYDTLTIIGKPLAPDQKVPADGAAGNADLAKVRRWPVTISYFDKEKKERTGEQMPAYAIQFELYENGISRALTLDYGDFAIAGELTSIEVKKNSKPCP